MKLNRGSGLTALLAATAVALTSCGAVPGTTQDSADAFESMQQLQAAAVVAGFQCGANGLEALGGDGTTGLKCSDGTTLFMAPGKGEQELWSEAQLSFITLNGPLEEQRANEVLPVLLGRGFKVTVPAGDPEALDRAAVLADGKGALKSVSYRDAYDTKLPWAGIDGTPKPAPDDADQDAGQGPDAVSGRIPRGGNLGGGITLVSGTTLAGTPGTELDPATIPPRTGQVPATAAPREVRAAPAGEPLSIVLYVGAGGHSANFEQVNAAYIDRWLVDGQATVEYRYASYVEPPPIYARANALACVADAAPASYLPFYRDLIAGGYDLDPGTEALAALAKDNGADVAGCIEAGTFELFGKLTDEAARTDGIAGVPAVFVQGREWIPPEGLGFEAFGPAVQELIDTREK